MSEEANDEEQMLLTKLGFHPFKLFKKQKVKDRAEQYEQCLEFITEAQEILAVGCPRLRFRKNRSHFESCRCVAFLELLDEDLQVKNEKDVCILKSIARFMVYYYNMSDTDKLSKVMDWIKYSFTKEELDERDDNKARFCLPMLGLQDDEKPDFDFESHKICKCALGYILDFKLDRWNKMKDAVKNNKLILHGNTGNNHAGMAFDAKVKDALFDFFDDVQETEGAPQSTRLVREFTYTGLRDGEEGVVELPPSLSKRCLYRRFVEGRGWTVKQSGNGSIQLVQRVGEEIQKVCSWTKFLRYWKEKFPKLKTRKPGEDVCNLCFQFSNRFRYRRPMEEEVQEEPQCQSVQENSDGEAADQHDSNQDEDEESTSSIPLLLGVTDKMVECEELVQEAALHVKQARGMRVFANEKCKEAQEHSAANKEHKDRTYALVIDYAQNAELPHLGAEQPGATYYYSPLNVNIFGIVNAGQEKGHLYSYIYHEGQGKKGGNNVASLLIQNLKEQGLLSKEKGPGGELNIICDNCQGQNKNNMVIRLAPLLVELGYFSKVNFIFYIVGHTKNICDRFFNLLKRHYRLKNIWTMETMKKEFETATKQLTVHIVDSSAFFNYAEKLDEVYCKFDSNICTDCHIFSANSNGLKDPTSLSMTTMIDSLETKPPHIQSLSLKRRAEHREYRPDKFSKKTGKKRKRSKADLAADAACDEFNKQIDREYAETIKRRKTVIDEGFFPQLSNLEPISISNLKQIGLGQKYRGFLPKDLLGNPLYAEPSKQMLDKEAKRRKARKALKEEATLEDRQQEEDQEGTGSLLHQEIREEPNAKRQRLLNSVCNV